MKEINTYVASRLVFSLDLWSRTHPLVEADDESSVLLRSALGLVHL